MKEYKNTVSSFECGSRGLKLHLLEKRQLCLFLKPLMTQTQQSELDDLINRENECSKNINFWYSRVCADKESYTLAVDYNFKIEDEVISTIRLVKNQRFDSTICRFLYGLLFNHLKIGCTLTKQIFQK